MEEEKEKKWEKKKRKKRKKDEKALADSPLEWKLLCHLVIISQESPGHKILHFVFKPLWKSEGKKKKKKCEHNTGASCKITQGTHPSTAPE